MDDPADVAGLVAAEHQRRCGARGIGEQGLDRRQGRDEPRAVVARPAASAMAATASFDCCSSGAWAARPSSVRSIRLRRPSLGHGRAGDQPGLLQPLQGAAEIARIEAEIAGKIGRRQAVAMGQLIEQARLGERETALQQVLIEHTDAARIEPVEAADGINGFGRDRVHKLP